MTLQRRIRAVLGQWRMLAAVLLMLAVIAPRAARAGEPDKLSGKVLLLAAASATDALDEIRGQFVKLHPGVTVRTSYGASSTLAQQIAAGAEAELFLSASSQWAQFVEQKQPVARQVDLLGNQLVIVTGQDSKLQLDGLAGLRDRAVRRLALGDPKSVPAGIYARQALERAGVWKDVERKVVGAADVRQALRFVETGAAEAGIVYASDTVAIKAVRVAAKIDPALSDPIRYPLVLLKRGAGNRAAEALYDYLASPAATDVFRRYGFLVGPAPDAQPK